MLLMAAIFVVDLYLPLGVAGGVPYVIPVLLGWWFSKNYAIALIAFIASVLTLIGLVLSPEGSPHWVVLINRFMALFVIWVSVGIILIAKELGEQHAVNQERFQRNFDSPLIGCGIYKPDKSWISFNDKLCEMMGYEREEFMRLTWENITHPDDLEKNLSLYDSSLLDKDRDTYSMEKRFIRKDGATVYSELFVQCVRGKLGEPAYNIMQVVDTSDRKQAEESLRQNESILKGITGNLPGALFRRILHTDGNISFELYEGSLLREFELEDYPINQQMTAKLILPEDNNIREQAIRESAKTLEPCDYQFRIKAPDGSIRWIRSFSTPTRRDNGETVWDGISLDITELKNVENELRESEARLKEAQKIAHIGNWSRTLDNNEIIWSDEMYRIFGFEPSGIDLTFEKLLEMIHPNDLDAWKLSLKNAITDKTPHSMEYRIIRSNGDIRRVYVHAIPTLDDEGNPSKISGTLQDITEQWPSVQNAS